jgi:hypothetical protein
MALFTALPAGVQLLEVDTTQPVLTNCWFEARLRSCALLLADDEQWSWSFAKVAMGICSQDGNDHLYCNDCHRGSYYWDHCTATCWGEREVLVKTAAMLVATVPQTTVVQCIAGKRPNSETDFPGAIIWMVQPPRTVTFQHECNNIPIQWEIRLQCSDLELSLVSRGFWERVGLILRVGLNAEQSLDTSKAGLHSTLSSL